MVYLLVSGLALRLFITPMALIIKSLMESFSVTFSTGSSSFINEAPDCGVIGVTIVTGERSTGEPLSYEVDADDTKLASRIGVVKVTTLFGVELSKGVTVIDFGTVMGVSVTSSLYCSDCGMLKLPLMLP